VADERARGWWALLLGAAAVVLVSLGITELSGGAPSPCELVRERVGERPPQRWEDIYALHTGSTNAALRGCAGDGDVRR
jgi:hypothetical protein